MNRKTASDFSFYVGRATPLLPASPRSLCWPMNVEQTLSDQSTPAARWTTTNFLNKAGFLTIFCVIFFFLFFLLSCRSSGGPRGRWGTARSGLEARERLAWRRERRRRRRQRGGMRHGKFLQYARRTDCGGQSRRLIPYETYWQMLQGGGRAAVGWLGVRRRRHGALWSGCCSGGCCFLLFKWDTGS